jgi:hypothetical protein
MEAKVIRFCVECGKQHDTGVENRMTGEFNRIEKCVDCLMSKCSFKFETRQITLQDLDEVAPKSYDEMQRELGETMLNILQTEYGTTQKVGVGQCVMCDAEGKEMDIKCKCGNDATSVMVGQHAYMGLCNTCQYGDSNGK